MTYHFSRERADDYASYLNRTHIGTPTRQGTAIITRYVISQYTGTPEFGVIQKWRYTNGPNQEFGGAFMWSDNGELPRPMD